MQLSALPSQAVQLVDILIHTIFVNGYVIAMRPTLLDAVAALAEAGGRR